MSENYRDITLKVFDEVFKDDCYYYTGRGGSDAQKLVTVFGWEFFWCGITDDAFIAYDSYLDVHHRLEYSGTYEDDLRQLLLDHIIPDIINECAIQDELTMYYALKNKDLIEFTHSDVSVIPNTQIYYEWEDDYLTIECCDSHLIKIYGKKPFPNRRFTYSDIDGAILYAEAVRKFLTDTKEVLDGYIRFADSINQLVQEVRDDVRYKLQDSIEDIIKLDDRG